VHKFFYLFAALVWTGVILFGCLIQASDVPTIRISNIDKLVHAFFYFVFTILWFLTFYKVIINVNFVHSLLFSFLFSILLGIFIEILQETLTTTRHGDLLDVLANISGSLLAIISVRLSLGKTNK
jgi:VanZ family protein